MTAGTRGSILRHFEKLEETSLPVAPTKLLSPDPRQTAHFRLVAKGFFSRHDLGGGVVFRSIHIDLKDSVAGPGRLVFDDPQRRGFFMDRVEVQLWLQDPAQDPDPERPLSAYQLSTDQPETKNENGAVTSSISYGVGTSLGFFGAMPTAGSNVSFSHSSSHTHQLTDFAFSRHLRGDLVQHELAMEQLGDGTPYGRPEDYPTDGDLAELPDLARSNIAIPTQAVWSNHDGKGLPLNEVILNINLKVRLIFVVSDENPPLSSVELSSSYRVPIDCRETTGGA